jgi:hypothetical protein
MNGFAYATHGLLQFLLTVLTLVTLIAALIFGLRDAVRYLPQINPIMGLVVKVTLFIVFGFVLTDFSRAIFMFISGVSGLNPFAGYKPWTAFIALDWLLLSQIMLLIPEFLYRQKQVRHEPNDLNEPRKLLQRHGWYAMMLDNLYPRNKADFDRAIQEMRISKIEGIGGYSPADERGLLVTATELSKGRHDLTTIVRRSWSFWCGTHVGARTPRRASAKHGCHYNVVGKSWLNGFLVKISTIVSFPKNHATGSSSLPWAAQDWCGYGIKEPGYCY